MEKDNVKAGLVFLLSQLEHGDLCEVVGSVLEAQAKKIGGTLMTWTNRDRTTLIAVACGEEVERIYEYARSRMDPGDGGKLIVADGVESANVAYEARRRDFEKEGG